MFACLVQVGVSRSYSASAFKTILFMLQSPLSSPGVNASWCAFAEGSVRCSPRRLPAGCGNSLCLVLNSRGWFSASLLGEGSSRQCGWDGARAGHTPSPPAGGPAHAPPLSPSARVPGQTFTNRAPLASPESVPSVLVTLPLVCPWTMFIG